MTDITFATVCSGIGAPEVAWGVLGWRALWASEIESAPSSVLAHHWPHVPNMGDMRKLPDLIRQGTLVAPDVLCGGTPCQAYSLAGLRLGLEDERGQLTLKFVELADAIDEKRPVGDECVIVWENVPGVLSDSTNAFGCLLAGLAGEDEPLVCPGGKWPNAGVVIGPARAVTWRVVDAQYFGVAQRRRRVLVVASAREGFDPAAVLFEFEGVRRDTAPRRETGQDVAGCLAARTGGGGFPGTDEACSGYRLQVAAAEPLVMAHGQGGAEISVGRCPTLTCNHEAPILVEQRMGTETVTTADIIGTLNGSGGHAYPGQTIQDVSAHMLILTREQSPIAFSCKDYGADASVDLAPTMRAMGHADSHANAGGQLAVAQCVTEPVTHTLKAEGFDASEDGTGRGQPIVPTLSFHVDAQPDQMRFDPDVAATQSVSQRAGVLYRHAEPRPIWRVRRLTPRECERLQGFPDEHTLVPHRGKPMADGPRYKALGNSMCVFKMRWLGVRIDAALRRVV